MRRPRQLFIILGAWLFLGANVTIVTAANAAGLEVLVRNANGEPMAEAVITLTPLDGDLQKPAIPAEPIIINQRNTAYDPFVTVIPVGTSVRFSNGDPFGHHVYSFSNAKRFEHSVPSNMVSEPEVFDRPGVVVMGCNIHDRMLAYVQVVDAPYFNKSDQTGRVAFEGLKPGEYRVTAWHPWHRPKDDKLENVVVVGEAETAKQEFVLNLKRVKSKKSYRF